MKERQVFHFGFAINLQDVGCVLLPTYTIRSTQAVLSALVSVCEMNINVRQTS